MFFIVKTLNIEQSNCKNFIDLKTLIYVEILANYKKSSCMFYCIKIIIRK